MTNIKILSHTGLGVEFNPDSFDRRLFINDRSGHVFATEEQARALRDWLNAVMPSAIDQLHAAVKTAQELAATRLMEVEQLQQRLKRHEPVSLYNGHDIDWWKNEAEQLRTALQLLHHRASEELGGFHSLVTLAEEILEMVPAPEPSDGPHRAFLEMPEGYSGPVKISNPGASVAEVTVYKGDPEPLPQRTHDWPDPESPEGKRLGIALTEVDLRRQLTNVVVEASRTGKPDVARERELMEQIYALGPQGASREEPKVLLHVCGKDGPHPQFSSHCKACEAEDVSRDASSWPCEQHPTVYILSFGSYADRFVFSVHSTREKAIAVHRLTEAESTHPEPLDIEEYELDPDLCVVCGHEADNSSAHKNHEFISGRSAQKPQDASSERPLTLAEVQAGHWRCSVCRGYDSHASDCSTRTRE